MIFERETIYGDGRSSDFEGFRVLRESTEEGPRWVVELPHQCDEWIVAWGFDAQEVVDKVTAFIADATAAKDALVAQVGSADGQG